MRYLTVAGVGVLTAIASAILWILVSFVVPVAVPFLMFRLGLGRSGIGGGSAVITSGSILLAASFGFIAGVLWMLWKSRVT